jgi:predicted Rossmann fold nucleotide-binding protein DprA/Smf involved in DNA uptake
LDLPDLEAVIHSPSFFEDGAAYFNGVWAQADDEPPGQQAILRALAPGPANREALASRTGLAAAALGAALHTLEQHDVVRNGGEQGYGFTVELMRLWVLQRQVVLPSPTGDGDQPC